MKLLRQALLSALWALPMLALAQGHVHQHGVLKLDIAVESRKLSLQMASPLDNLVGFERAPRNAAERQRVDAALASYSAGRGPLSAVLEARRTLLETRLMRLELAADVLRHRLQLQYFEMEPEE